MPVSQVYRPAAGLAIVRLATGGLSSYLVVSGGESFLVEGAASAAEVGEACRAQDCALPSFILHSFLKDGFCVADHGLGAVSHVPAGLEYIASGGEPSLKPPPVPGVLADWSEKRGEEPFGIMGCVTTFPLRRGLGRFRRVEDGQAIVWRGHVVKAVRTPSHGKYSMSYVLSDGAGVVRAVFCGGLVTSGGAMPNYYDAEWEYGLMSGLVKTQESAGKLLALGDGFRLYPAYGGVIAKPRAALEALRRRAGELVRHQLSPTGIAPRTLPAEPFFENYARLAPGVYRMTTGGNVVLLVAPDGEGLMIDPGPCYYHLPGKAFFERFELDLERFEQHAGLRRVSLALLTHFHGDHVDCAGLLRRRYGTVVRAPRLVAEVVAAPGRYNYIGLSPSYNYGVEKVEVDSVMRLGRRQRWHGCELWAFPLPGHCRRHVGYAVKFGGRILLMTGDYFMAGAELNPNVVVVHNESDEGGQGYLRGLDNIVRQHGDWIITGHSTALEADPATLGRFRSWLLRRRSLFQALAGGKSLRQFLLPPT